MLSAFNDRDNVVRALDNGALGFIPKTDSREVLLSALRLILAGGIYIPPEVLAREPAGGRRGRTSRRAERRPSPAELGLTERQVEVLALMMQGKSNKVICRALELAEPTVKNHVSAILKALEGHEPDRGGAGRGGTGLGAARQLVERAHTGSSRSALSARVFQQLGHDGAQRHGNDRLVQEMMAARVDLAQALR